MLSNFLFAIPFTAVLMAALLAAAMLPRRKPRRKPASKPPLVQVFWQWRASVHLCKAQVCAARGNYSDYVMEGFEPIALAMLRESNTDHTLATVADQTPDLERWLREGQDKLRSKGSRHS